MGGSIGGIGGVTGGAAKEAISGVGRMAAAEGSRVNGIIGQVVRNLTSSLTQAASERAAGGAMGGAAQQVLQSFQSDLTRLAYIAALQKAVGKAGRPGPFNVETAINDLWVALDGVRKGHAATRQSIQAQAQRQSEMLTMMSNMMSQMHDAAASVIQNMR